MTEYEMADLINSSIANMLTGQALYFSQIGSYLAVAWLIGSKLTRFQVTFLNSLLVLLTVSGLGNFTTLVRKNFAVIDELREIGSITVVNSPVESDVVIALFLVFRALILIGALLFMWQVRHPKTE